MSYLIKNKDRILIVNISTEMDNHHHLLRKEEGFIAYLKDHNQPAPFAKLDIKRIDYRSVKDKLSKELTKFNDIKLIFVTNSKVSIVARYLQESKKDILLVGYDFVKENIAYLDKGIINFLICQKPMEQAYKGVMTIYQHLALSAEVKNIQFMPIDIITKENYAFYENYPK